MTTVPVVRQPRLHPTSTSLALLAALSLVAATSSAAVDASADIALDMVGGRPQVNVLIAGKGPFPFVLDTGSSLNVIDSGVARGLGLEVVGETEIGAPGMPQVPAEIVRGGTLEVQGIELAGGEFVTVDLAGMAGGLFLGVLRFSVFAESLATLDLAAGTLRLSRGSLDRDSHGVIAFDTVEGLIDIPISIGGRAATAHVDTGSPGSITLPSKIANELSFVEPPVVIGEARLVGGSGTMSRGTLDGDITIGPIRLEDPEVMIFDVPVPKVNLGSAFLAGHLVHVDQQNGLIRFDPREPGRAALSRGPAPSGGRRLGLRPVPGPPGPNGLALRDDGLPVEWVEPGGLASEAGLIAGDLIRSVNGISLPELTAASLIALFGGSEPLRMEVERADSAVEVVEIP